MADYLPVLKAVLPYIGPLVSAATPIFTRSSGDSGKDQSSTPQLISELQEAVKNNANSLRVVATQLQNSIEAFDERELLDQKRFSEMYSLLETNAAKQDLAQSSINAMIKDLQLTKMVSLGALVMALISVGVAVFR